MKYNSKLVLGTAQFGLDYGVNNQRGRIPEQEAFAVIEEAYQSGSGIIDTAFHYGESERVIGRYIGLSGKKLDVVSKLSKCASGDLEGYFNKSLSFLNLDHFYGYLLHDFYSFQADPSIWQKLEALKKSGRTKKIGFSLYYPTDLQQLLEREIKFDLLQVPYNIYDRRFESYFKLLRKAGVEIHARSVFLQGLVFKNPSKLHIHFTRIVKKLEHLQAIAVRGKISIAALCLGFALENKEIDKVVIGVDSLENLREILSIAANCKENIRLINEIDGLAEEDERILLPVNWPNLQIGVVN